MVTPFANTLKASYYEHVKGSSTQQFADAVTPGHCGLILVGGLPKLKFLKGEKFSKAISNLVISRWPSI
jgi:hypothetical protein